LVSEWPSSLNAVSDDSYDFYSQRYFLTPPLLRERASILPASFDAVVMMDVLGHLPNPLDSMSHLQALLKDEGICVIQTPHYESGRTDDWPQFKAPEHLSLFSKHSLTMLLEKVGFLKVCFLEPFNGEGYDRYCLAGKGAVHELGAKRLKRLPAGGSYWQCKTFIDASPKPLPPRLKRPGNSCFLR
jgi:SAM-dependent methyltransferase